MPSHGNSRARCDTDLTELKELLLGLGAVGALAKAVVAKGIGPLQDAPAVNNLSPGVQHKLELAGGRGCDLTQLLQLVCCYPV